MSVFARSLVSLSLFGLLALGGCSASHVTTGDAGPGSDAPLGDATCTGSSSLFCVSSCGSDAGYPPVCASGAWRCPTGTVDITTCPPGCIGRPPGPDCVCRGTEWSCASGMCPPGIDPWATPGTPCTTEGAHCTSGTSDACGSAMFCDCEGGHWSCAVAEPDPVCWCGREPAAGDRCSEEGATCGECCPTPGGTGWDAMTCVDGHWQPGDCRDVLCEALPEACPVSREAALGTSCSTEGQICGNACCDLGFMCNGGVWTDGPLVDCVTCDPSASFSCGIGTCERGQACTSQCGPTDGIEHVCTLLEPGCNSCDCATIPAGYTCESRGGYVFFSMMSFCG